eukprot:augustus_masked-scaffold_15-processed-gene-7.66-mRNA-1 protein AED:1.00 eAED:1.00 QI:0/-1/0/0/-1/1/1/0/193
MDISYLTLSHQEPAKSVITFRDGSKMNFMNEHMTLGVAALYEKALQPQNRDVGIATPKPTDLNIREYANKTDELGDRKYLYKTHFVFNTNFCSLYKINLYCSDSCYGADEETEQRFTGLLLQLTEALNKSGHRQVTLEIDDKGEPGLGVMYGLYKLGLSKRITDFEFIRYWNYENKFCQNMYYFKLQEKLSWD